MAFTAAEDPRLARTDQQWQEHLQGLKSGAGSSVVDTASQVRDAREGGLTAMKQMNALAGRGGGAGIAGYMAETGRQVNRAITDTAANREKQYTEALTNSQRAAEAPAAAALAEKGFGLNSWQAQQNAAMEQQRQEFEQALAAQQNAQQQLAALYGATSALQTQPLYQSPTASSPNRGSTFGSFSAPATRFM